MLPNQKGAVPILVIVVVVAILGIGGYFVLGKNSSTNPPVDTQNETSKSKTHADSRRGFSVSYPKDWIVNEIMGSAPTDPGNPGEKTVEFRPAGQRYIPLFLVSKIEKGDKWNPEEFKKESAKPGTELSQKESTITVNDITGWNLTAVTKNFDSVDYFQYSLTLLSKDDRTYYQVEIWDAQEYTNKEILHQMLNSFRIL